MEDQVIHLTPDEACDKHYSIQCVVHRSLSLLVSIQNYDKDNHCEQYYVGHYIPLLSQNYDQDYYCRK